MQTLESRHELEMKEKGKKDIIYSYHKAIGTYGKSKLFFGSIFFNCFVC